jgi:hypothetical protein
VFGHSKRVLALAMAGVGTAALVVVSGGAANADVSGGTVTLTVNDSFLVQLAKSAVLVVPEGTASTTTGTDPASVVITFTATGGLGDLANSAGSINLAGSLISVSLDGKSVTLGALNLNLGGSTFDGATATGQDTPLLDLAGTEDGTITGSDETYEASDLTIDPAGAALLNAALGTKAFKAGQDIGSISAAWTES